MTPSVDRARTAMTRVNLSRPMSAAIGDGILKVAGTLFDFGCGRGHDLRTLRTLGYTADGWDPHFRPEAPLRVADVVNLGYVVNVIEDPAERASTLRRAWELATKVLVVSGRLTWEARELVGNRFGDGILTRIGTFQKFFEQAELADWIASTLDVRPLAAAPGIFYVFRDSAAEQDFLSRRVYSYRPRIQVDPRTKYEQHADDLAPLLAFITNHARPPRQGELPQAEGDRICSALGSLRAASSLILQMIEEAQWEELVRRRREELLIYVALSRFTSRPKFTQLGPGLAGDLRVLFGTYRQACIQADKLLLAAGNPVAVYLAARSSKVGKQTPTALYVHVSALGELPPVLQVYEACARILSGNVTSTKVLKLSVVEPQVSYLSYPCFDRDAHPVLESAVTVNLRSLTVNFRDYSRSENPPLLHRKEEFLGLGDSRRGLYSRLTRSEIRAGLYAHPEQIGHLKGWAATLSAAGVRVAGHRLIRSS